MIARLALLLLVCSQLAWPAAAVAQGSPFGPIPQTPPEQAPAPAPTNTDPADDGLSERQQLLIGLASVALIAGIAWAILRDAKSAAPAETRGPLGEETGEKVRGTRTPPKRRVKQNRAKAKTARQARKRNR